MIKINNKGVGMKSRKGKGVVKKQVGGIHLGKPNDDGSAKTTANDLERETIQSQYWNSGSDSVSCIALPSSLTSLP